MIAQVNTIILGKKSLRDYQASCIDRIRDGVRAGHKRQIVESPTGSGKTVIACALIKLSADKGKWSMFLAPRRELIRQTSDHLDDCGVRHSIIAAGFESLPGSACYVCSKDTLAARALRRSRIEIPKTDLLIVDECHLTAAREWQALLAKIEAENPNVVVIGLSATPGRADGKGLGDYWQRIEKAATYSELISQRFLVPCRVFSPSTPDMRGVRAVDWDSEAAARVDKPKLVGDVVEHWLRHAKDRLTFCFGSTVAHSIHLCDEFRKHGVAASHVDEDTDPKERDQMFADLEAGRIQVLCNCDVCTYGVDVPPVSCVVLVAPSRSLVRFRQRAGRALRPADGKEDCLILDHAGAVFMHGFPDEDIDWPLEKTRSIDKEYQAKRQKGKTREPIHCPNCGCTYECNGRPVCPNCGSRVHKRGKDIAIAKGLLKEVKRSEIRNGGNSDVISGEGDLYAMYRKHWHKCLAQMARKGRSCGAAAAMFTKHWGVKPWHVPDLPNMPPMRDDWKKPVSTVFPQYVR